jgi:hypothetical protein
MENRGISLSALASDILSPPLDYIKTNMYKLKIVKI